MYRHKYEDILGKRKEKKKSGFETERAALKALLDVKSALLSGDTRQIEHEQMTVSQWVDIWYETYYRDWELTTRSNISDAVRLHIKPILGKYKLNKLTYSTYKGVFINTLLDDGFSPNSVRLYHKYFMMVINSAVRDEILKENKFRSIKIKNDKSDNNFLTPNELIVFLKHAENIGNITEYTLTLLLVYSGIRKGEATGLKWRNIDFNNNTVTIKRTRDSKGPRSPKTTLSYRTIGLDPFVIKYLESYKKWCIKTKFSHGIPLSKDDYVFITGRSINGVGATYINCFFKKIYDFLKKEDIKLKRITPHGLRHTHATILIDALVPPGDVADRLGNTLEMIYKVYAHKFKKHNNETATAFGTQLNKVAK